MKGAVTMKDDYTVLFEKGNYALIERGINKEYAVVYNLVPESERRYKGGDWEKTVAHTMYHSLTGLSYMIEKFRMCTEENYITRQRFRELAILL